jgi:hypothetical protein
MYSPISVQVPATALWAESILLCWATLKKIREFYKPLKKCVALWPTAQAYYDHPIETTGNCASAGLCHRHLFDSPEVAPEKGIIAAGITA